MVRPLPVAASLIATSLFMLTACGGHKPADDAEAGDGAATSTAKARQKTVFDDQLKALDKAKAVEQQLQQDKEKTDRAIEDAGG